MSLTDKTDWCLSCGRGWTWVDGSVHAKAQARVAELEGQLRDMRILGGKTLAERNDALARVAELEDIRALLIEALAHATYRDRTDAELLAGPFSIAVRHRDYVGKLEKKKCDCGAKE